MFGLGISVTVHKAGAEQLWDKEVFPSSGRFMGKDHKQSRHKKSWRKEQQEKGALQARAVAEEQLLLPFFPGLWWKEAF